MPYISAETAMTLKYDIFKTFIFVEEEIDLTNILSLQCQIIVVESLLPDWEAELNFHYA
jgi:hypothetical protein